LQLTTVNAITNASPDTTVFIKETERFLCDL
jgi:hypothetical protein